MYIAIDDTYSSNVTIDSNYVTSNRRTNVAICFADDEVEHVREELNSCLDELTKLLGKRPSEFHFVEIVNKKRDWISLSDDHVLRLLSFFVKIYNHYRWPVLIQTVDDRTFADHGVAIATNVHGLDPQKKEDQSLFLLILKLRQFLKGQKVVLIMDEGRGDPGDEFGKGFFPDWAESFEGYYESSKQEPLLQIADFIAYAINRLTNLSTKSNRSSHEQEQIRILGQLDLNSDDVRIAKVRPEFGRAEFDAIHLEDRKAKGLEPR